MDPGTTIAASGSRGRKTKPAEQTRIGKRASREDTVHVGFLYAGSVRPTASDRATGCAQSAAWLWHNRFRGLRRPLTQSAKIKRGATRRPVSSRESSVLTRFYDDGG